ncbi:hypothetical protein [Paenibacillus sp. Soil787]|uniref:hypothetical protein n=1 Tax=Paenibacillus sp. Soil787 TaxID=1736411 RepID=UPI0007035AA6|nr:hypothetical protein [Paenibacillus sp. Soil787]KRF27636.1 hypothetical protein ASG93_29265 [Paenibacillus sp. Soil787]
MNEMTAVIFTITPFNTAEIANKFFENLVKKGFTPQKIGTYEPLRKSYTPSEAMEMWTREEAGCFDEKVGRMVGKAGGMLGKSISPAFQFTTQWYKCPNKVSLNYIDFYFSLKTFMKHKDAIVTLFKETIELVDGIHGYISHDKAQTRQHVTGTLETRMPGVFWCNYFGKTYVDFFRQDTILSLPWQKTESLSNGLLTLLANEPHQELLDSPNLETTAKELLGIDSFGNKAEYDATPNHFGPQYKRVPPLG